MVDQETAKKWLGYLHQAVPIFTAKDLKALYEQPELIIPKKIIEQEPIWVEFDIPQPFSSFNLGLIFLTKTDMMVFFLMDSEFTQFLGSYLIKGIETVEQEIPEQEIFRGDEAVYGVIIKGNNGYIRISPNEKQYYTFGNLQMILDVGVGISPKERLGIEIPFKLIRSSK